MSVRRVLAVAGATLLGVFALATPAAAHVFVAADDTGSGRGMSTVALVVGLIGIVLGVLALRSAGRRAIAALAVGLIGVVLGGLALAGSSDDVGTGNGRGGAIAALVVGLIGVVLGGLALARSRRTADRLPG
ncbi:DUF6223 family protein [Streptomyces sp. NPDC052236]|uniref:DUF6223 family protein n=1 Tax=Streptomyces sp. NPDC052236 TaxID=3365686 RepID=UPI0037D95BE4